MDWKSKINIEVYDNNVRGPKCLPLFKTLHGIEFIRSACKQFSIPAKNSYMNTILASKVIPGFVDQ